MREKYEENIHGKLSLLEVLLLKTIIMYFMLHGLDITIEGISCLYNMAVALGRMDDLINLSLSTLEKTHSF